MPRFMREQDQKFLLVTKVTYYPVWGMNSEDPAIERRDDRVAIPLSDIREISHGCDGDGAGGLPDEPVRIYLYSIEPNHIYIEVTESFHDIELQLVGLGALAKKSE